MILSSIYKSIVRNTVDLISDINATMPGVDLRYQDWESRFDENSLPKTNLLGVDGFTWEENNGLWVTRHGLALSSYRDANLLNEIELIDAIHAWTGERKKLDILNPVTGELVGEFVVAAWQLAPMAQSQFRNYRTISLELLRTSSAFPD